MGKIGAAINAILLIAANCLLFAGTLGQAIHAYSVFGVVGPLCVYMLNGLFLVIILDSGAVSGSPFTRFSNLWFLWVIGPWLVWPAHTILVLLGLSDRLSAWTVRRFSGLTEKQLMRSIRLSCLGDVDDLVDRWSKCRALFNYPTLTLSDIEPENEDP